MLFRRIALLLQLNVILESGGTTTISLLDTAQFYATHISETQTDMYDFEMHVHESIQNDQNVLRDYIIPLMHFLDGEGGIERAALLNRMLGMSKISFVHDKDDFIKLVSEIEVQINIQAYVQDIQSTGKPFIEAVFSEPIKGNAEIMERKIEDLEHSACEFWVEDSFDLPLDLQRCVHLDKAIRQSQRLQPWKRQVPGTSLTLWLSDPTDRAPGSENVQFTTLAQEEGLSFEATLSPVLKKIFATPYIAAFLSTTGLRDIVLTEELYTSTNCDSLGITVCPESDGTIIGRGPPWQTIFIKVDNITPGTAYRTLLHETMHTWANTFPNRFWAEWTQIHGGNHLYTHTIDKALLVTAQQHNAAILGFSIHLGVTSPVGLMSRAEDVPEFLRTLLSESGCELLRRRCGFDAAEYNFNKSPDMIMRAKVLALVELIDTHVSNELAVNIRQTLFGERKVKRTKQGHRIFLVQTDDSMESYLSCDMLAAKLLREGATVTHFSPWTNGKTWKLETLLGPDPHGVLHVGGNSYLYIVGETLKYKELVDSLLVRQFGADSLRIVLVADSSQNIVLLDHDLNLPANAHTIRKHIHKQISSCQIECVSL